MTYILVGMLALLSVAVVYLLWAVHELTTALGLHMDADASFVKSSNNAVAFLDRVAMDLAELKLQCAIKGIGSISYPMEDRGDYDDSVTRANND